MEVRPVDVHDDAELRRFHEIGWRSEMEDGRPWNTFQEHAEMKAALRRPLPDARIDAIGLYDGERMVGGGIVRVPLEDNLEKAFLYPCVEPELRRRGIGGALLEGLVEHARGLGRTELTSAFSVPFEERDRSVAERFARDHGFEHANLEVVRQLDLPVADALLEGIEAEVRAHASGYEVRTFTDGVPEELLASYCLLVGQLVLEAPMGDVEYEEEVYSPESARQELARDRSVGRVVVRSLAVRDGQVVAHSDLLLRPSTSRAQQWGTLVQRDHRGHRLGAAVKAANLRWVQEHRPGITEISTENAEVNDAMIGINERLGFVPVALVHEVVRRL